jgi:hypothetical protein
MLTAGVPRASTMHTQAAEKVSRSEELLDLSPAGAKAHFVLMALSARLKSCPDTKRWRALGRLSFSEACKAPVIRLAFCRG